MRKYLGTYTPNYNLYMPSIGEQGWGELVSNNFEILDTNLNDLQNHINTIDTQIDTINTNIGNGTRTLFILLPNTTTNTINSENFGKYAFASYDNNNVYIASFGSPIIFESIPQPSHSCRLMIISVNGDLTINGNIDTYPTTLQNELPPNSPETNIYNNNINFVQISYEITLEYTANGNNSKFSINYEDYLNFINETLPTTSSQINKSYQLSIPHAIAAGGYGGQNGTAGTAENTCNGGGGGGGGGGNSMGNYTGGTGCIFGQYEGCNFHGNRNGYGYGSSASNKYRCALIFVVNGNLTINENGTITQNGGNGNGDRSGYGNGGYGGGAIYGGGGGAPVFIYYTGTYTNNGTINTAGGSGWSGYGIIGGIGGAGGIKTTKITL